MQILRCAQDDIFLGWAFVTERGGVAGMEEPQVLRFAQNDIGGGVRRSAGFLRFAQNDIWLTQLHSPT